jgi:hypothetical protein
MAAMGGLLPTPLAAWERDGLKTALVRAGLPADDIRSAFAVLAVREPRECCGRFRRARNS